MLTEKLIPEKMPSSAMSSSHSLRCYAEATRIFDELPTATIVAVSRPEAGDISPVLLSYRIEVQYKQVKLNLLFLLFEKNYLIYEIIYMQLCVYAYVYVIVYVCRVECAQVRITRMKIIFLEYKYTYVVGPGGCLRNFGDAEKFFFFLSFFFVGLLRGCVLFVKTNEISRRCGTIGFQLFFKIFLFSLKIIREFQLF